MELLKPLFFFYGWSVCVENPMLTNEPGERYLRTLEGRQTQGSFAKAHYPR